MFQQATPHDEDGLTGFTGFVADVIAWIGEVGVGALVFLETVFPPLPSEAVLGLAGWQAQMGRMNLVLAMIAATIGAVLGGLVFYAFGAWFGEERAKTLLARVPLIDRDDLDAASDFFRRYGQRIVFFGRFVPIVRSLVSIPAGAQRMPLGTFIVLTALGAGSWNAILIGAGYLLGTQYELLEGYLKYLDYVVIAAIAIFVGWYLIRWYRKHHRPA
ncbi:MAG: DedA family protein [Chloroflexi bacterium]|nr:DedA family protein [Chloroflexota bacterium]